MLYFSHMRFLLVPILLLLSISTSYAETSRLASISNALDAFDQKLEKAFDAFARTDSSKKQDLGPRKTQSLDVGYETYFYQYWESIPIKITGWMNGYYANYAYRPQEDNVLNNAVLNAYMLEFRYASGKGRYKSDSGVLEDDKSYNLEMRALLGKDYLVSDNVLITPYLGFGYRHLYNPVNGRQTDKGAWGYDRRSYYYYLPIGFSVKMPNIYGSWSGAFNVEYDYFLRGVQLSDLNEATPYIGTEYPNISNRQNDGYGVRGSFRMMYSTPKIDFYVEPFIRFWNIEDSNVKHDVNHSGVASSWIEPHNTTKEIGSKFGLQF